MTARVTETDVGALIAEVERYLAVVTAFRAAGCEPHWRFEYPQPPSRADQRGT
jgi:hypothetical protein